MPRALCQHWRSNYLARAAVSCLKDVLDNSSRPPNEFLKCSPRIRLAAPLTSQEGLLPVSRRSAVRGACRSQTLQDDNTSRCVFASGSAAVFSDARLVLLLLAVSSRGRRLCLSLLLTGIPMRKKKKKLGSVSGVDDEFSLSGCSLFISHS